MTCPYCGSATVEHQCRRCITDLRRQQEHYTCRTWWLPIDYQKPHYELPSNPSELEPVSNSYQLPGSAIIERLDKRIDGMRGELLHTRNKLNEHLDYKKKQTKVTTNGYVLPQELQDSQDNQEIQVSQGNQKAQES
jgi:hypothetical protein